MLASFLNGGTLSLAVISFLASTAAADVFESLPGVPEGKLFLFLFFYFYFLLFFPLLQNHPHVNKP